MTDGGLVTTRKAAELLGVSTSTIYRMVERGTLTPSKTPGGQRRFDVDMVLKFKDESSGITAPQNPSRVRTRVVGNEQACVRDSDDVLAASADRPLDKRNSLNDLNGTQWLPETKSFFYQRGLGAKNPDAQIERQHPAPYSYQDIIHLVRFFTKHGMAVLDPFGGVGSTAKACELEGRTCTSIELQKKWNDLAQERLDVEVAPGASRRHTFIQGDARAVLQTFRDNTFDFVVTSPPYWSILNKKADYKVKRERLANGLPTRYSNNDADDLANISRYDDFLHGLVDGVFVECGRVLRPRKYMCLVVSDFRNKSEFISFHSDLIQALNRRTIRGGYKLYLQGVKILLQNHKSLLPYGYPFAYVENIHHQYVLIFRKGEDE